MGDEESGEPQVEASEKSNAFVLGYLTCPQDSAKGFLGALLITDGRARPLHFAYVSPVRPTLMQRILYGKTLYDHVRVDVITKKLFSGTPTRPHVLFVDSKELLAVRGTVGVPTANLQRTPATAEPTSSLSSLIYDVGGNGADEARIGRVIATLEQDVDLVEPFARMNEALKEVLKAEKSQ